MSAKSTIKIIHLRIDFLILLNFDDENVVKISDLIPLLVLVMSSCSQTFSVDFLEFLLKRRHLKNLKKFANKFIKNKIFNIMI